MFVPISVRPKLYSNHRTCLSLPPPPTLSKMPCLTAGLTAEHYQPFLPRARGSQSQIQASPADSYPGTEPSRNIRHVCFCLHVSSSYFDILPTSTVQQIRGITVSPESGRFCKLFKFNAKYVSDIKCHRLHSLCYQNSEHVKAIIVLSPKPRQTWMCLSYPCNAQRLQVFFGSLALNRRSNACNCISENPTSDLWELHHFQFH